MNRWYEKESRKKKVLICQVSMLCILCGLFFWGVRDYLFMEKSDKIVIELCGILPDQSMAVTILKQCQSAETVTDACFVCSEGIKTVQNQEYERSVQVQVTGCVGMASLYDRSGMALDEDDREGCVIDESTAEALYGSSDCVGNKLTLNGKEYQVCQTADWNERRILIHSDNKEQVFTQVLIRRQKNEITENKAEEFLMQNDLSGICIEDDWLDWMSALAVSLFPAVTVWGTGGTAALRMREKQKMRFMQVIWIVVLVTGLEAVFKLTEIPSGWIPDKWSDFEFWGEKILKEKENISWYLMSMKTPEQVRRMICAAGSVGKCVLSALASLAVWRRIWYGMKV